MEAEKAAAAERAAEQDALREAREEQALEAEAKRVAALSPEDVAAEAYAQLVQTQATEADDWIGTS